MEVSAERDEPVAGLGAQAAVAEDDPFDVGGDLREVVVNEDALHQGFAALAVEAVRVLDHLGLPVERVAICFWPRGGQIRNTFLWSEPYSDEIVEETTARIDSVILMIHDFDVEHHPANYAWIPATSNGCFLCAYYAKNPIVPTQCDGTNVGASGIARLAP